MRASFLVVSMLVAGCGSAASGPGPAEVAPALIPVAPPPRPERRESRREDRKPMPKHPVSSSPPTFADDLAFLKAHGDVQLLEAANGGRVALSAKYQGRVMTSAVDAGGRSFGWINRSFIAEGKTGTPFDNYGGEDRFWLGPEAGQFGLYFPAGSAFQFDKWQVPASMQEGAWDAKDATNKKVTFKKTMNVTNWTGTKLAVDVERTVALVEGDEAKKALGFDALSAKDVKSIAFATSNKITNAGKEPWKKDTGLVSVWVLSMFAPAEDGQVVIPFVKDGPGAIVNDAYFGKVPADRLNVKADKGFLLFKVDGKHRSKIGIPPAHAKKVLGSYSPSQKLLTIVQYDDLSKSAPYVNSMWEKQKEPFAGDAVNSYNDGSPGEGKPPLGGFYEIETSSPAAELAPGKSLVHVQRTFHFTGEESALEPIAKGVLGVSLADLK
jgi:hypothetical protein